LSLGGDRREGQRIDPSGGNLTVIQTMVVREEVGVKGKSQIRDEIDQEGVGS